MEKETKFKVSITLYKEKLVFISGEIDPNNNFFMLSHESIPYVNFTSDGLPLIQSSTFEELYFKSSLIIVNVSKEHEHFLELIEPYFENLFKDRDTQYVGQKVHIEYNICTDKFLW